MYSLTSANRYYLYQGFVRMNLGIDGLFKIIRSQMKELSPISGDIFLFFGKNRQSVKILRWDGDGFLLYYKRLEGGSFELPVFFQWCIRLPFGSSVYDIREILKQIHFIHPTSKCYRV